MFPGLDLYYTDPAQHLITAGWDRDDLDHDLSFRRLKACVPAYKRTADEAAVDSNHLASAERALGKQAPAVLVRYDVSLRALCGTIETTLVRHAP